MGSSCSHPRCQVPVAARSVDIAGAVRMMLEERGFVGPLVKFSAYGDFNLIRRDVRSELQASQYQNSTTPEA